MTKEKRLGTALALTLFRRRTVNGDTEREERTVSAARTTGPALELGTTAGRFQKPLVGSDAGNTAPSWLQSQSPDTGPRVGETLRAHVAQTTVRPGPKFPGNWKALLVWLVTTLAEKRL